MADQEVRREASTAAREADRDAVDRFVEQWHRELPDADPSPMEVVGRIHRLGALLDALLRPPFAERGLAHQDFDVLAALRRAGAPFELSPGELSRALLVTSGAVTKRVDRLERAGLVGRRVSPDDARGRIIALTPRGRALTEEVAGPHWANEDRLLAALDADERRQLAGLLRKLLVDLDAGR